MRTKIVDCNTFEEFEEIVEVLYDNRFTKEEIIIILEKLDAPEDTIDSLIYAYFL